MTEAAPKPADPRLGPRPLALHLWISGATLMSSAAGWTRWRNGSMPWRRNLNAAAEELDKAVRENDPAAVGRALASEAIDRFSRFLTGIRRYRAHPYRRVPGPSRLVWQGGTAQLHAFGDGNGGGLPVFVVPSLVNRSYILDLMEGRSLMRHLAAQGFRPFLLDWGAPGEVERGFDLSDYFTERLVPAFEAALAEGGGPAAVVGYCLGGTLALPLVQQARASVSGLALLAAPWDFHAVRPDLARATADILQAWLPIYDRMGEMPVDALQALFAGIDPHLALRKFCAFAELDPEGDAARHFVALEDWVNDGVPLAAPVARETLVGWYGENRTAEGQWRVAGETVDPTQIDRPVLAIMPARDRIVPLGCSRPLTEALPQATARVPEAGHIGMITGSRARTQVWEPLVAWLRTLAT